MSLVAPETHNSPSNAWGKAKVVKWDVEHVPVFMGSQGQAFNHQAQIVSDAGRLYASWSCGPLDEEEAGQKMLMAFSDDWGKSWSDPITVAPSRPGQHADSVIVSSGIRVHEGVLTAYYGEWERWEAGRNPEAEKQRLANGNSVFNLRTEARTSHDQGQTWSEPLLVMPNQMGFMPPSATQSGRLILPGHLTYAYTDDPQGLTGWRRASLPGLPADYFDDWYSHSKGCRLLGLEQRFNEAGFYQTDDGVLHMMMRNEGGYRLGMSESHDDGETWSMPVLTDFSNSISRSHFGRLPDGRHFCVNCPTPGADESAPTTRNPRTPLVLAISDDGRVFDQHYILGDDAQGVPRMPGYLKHGRYGYPYLHVSGKMAVVVYSVNKEDIFVARFTLPD